MKSTLLFTLLAITILLGVVCVPLMDNDAAHHAAIALHMSETGDYTTLVDMVNHYIPYLDKPHFQFWAVAASFNLFGVSGLVYKLSSILFILLSLFSTYKLGKILSGKTEVGIVASLVLCSMMAFLLGASVDIRMDAILSGAVIFAIWQGVLCIGVGANDNGERGHRGEKFNILHYLGLALGLAIAFSCKGFFGVVIVACALIFYMIGTKRLKWMVSWRFLVALGLFAVMILPEMWALYEQFGWRGVQFILYDQVMIRTGGGMGYLGDSDPLFFVHTLLWAVLPWCGVLFYFAARSLLSSRFDNIYWLTIPGSVAVIVLLSFSSFKLPHYLNPLFPLFAIFVAQQLLALKEKTKLIKGVAITQKILAALMITVAVLVNYWAFAFHTVWLSIVFGCAILYLIYQLFTPWTNYQKIITMSVVTAAVLWIGLCANFYPRLMEYQAGNMAAAELTERGIEARNVYLYEPFDYSSSFDIHHGAIHKILNLSQIKTKQAAGEEFYIFAERKPTEQLAQDSTLHFVHAGVWADYRITGLSVKFLNPATRADVIDSVFLIKFN